MYPGGDASDEWGTNDILASERQIELPRVLFYLYNIIFIFLHEERNIRIALELQQKSLVGRGKPVRRKQTVRSENSVNRIDAQ